MNKLEQLNSKIKNEASKILYNYDLLKILKKYGKPFITGSYSLDLMVWRDLDIHLEVDELTEKEFFNLGKEILQKFHPYKMSYRNNRSQIISRIQNLPDGLYWGIYTNLISNESWKIDIWAMDSKQKRLYRKNIEKIKSKIKPSDHLTILKIKNHYCQKPEYRK